MKMFVLLAVTFSFSALAEVSPEHVGSMLQQMVRENVISRQEADKALARMQGMTPTQWAQINKQAVAQASRMPASENVVSNNQIEEVKGIDLDGKQFQAIQNDLKKIVPQYKD